MRAENLLALGGVECTFVKSLEEDGCYWILDCEGEREVVVPGDLAQAFIDDPEFGVPTMEWTIKALHQASANAYQAGRNRGFDEGRAQVREALGMGEVSRAIDRLAQILQERQP